MIVSAAGGLVGLDTEPARQDSVTRYGLSGTESWTVPDPRLAALAQHAQRILGTDFCAVNILDGRRQWTVSSRQGAPVLLSPRSISVCQRMLSRVDHDGVMVLADASADAAVRAYAERTGAVILAEGVETEEQEQLARVFGATYAQGYRYGPPRRCPRHCRCLAIRSLCAHRRLATSRAPRFQALAQTRPPQVAAEDLLLHISGYLEDQSATELNASVLMAAFHGHRCSVVVADQTAFDGAAALLADEWFVLITKPHLAARQLADGRYEYVYTHDEGAVARAAHAFVGVLLAARG